MTVNPDWSEIPRGQVIAQHDAYDAAQRVVDFLSDEGFPVQHLAIVGNDLRMVEDVRGRLTRGRAAGAGAASGAWFGLLVGLLLALFAEGASILALVLAGVAYGAVFGAIFGFVGHYATGGRRDFVSRSKIVAQRYDVLCTWGEADRARELLARQDQART